MFGADYPLLGYERLLGDWKAEGYGEAVLDKVLRTSMLLLPLLNPVDAAENIATLDHITHGRLDVGVAIGYREKELEAAGLTRKDRVPKLEESLDVMKRLMSLV